MITKTNIEEVINKLAQEGLSLDQYTLLYCLAHGLDSFRKLKLDKLSNLRALQKRDFLDELEVTPRGLLFLSDSYVSTKKQVTVSTLSPKEILEAFNLFWQTYPVSDKHKHWKRTRTLRTNKPAAKKTYYNYVLQEKIRPSWIQKALEEEIRIMKEASILDNRFTYMPLVTTWLNQRRYESFEEEDEEEIISETKYGEEIE